MVKKLLIFISEFTQKISKLSLRYGKNKNYLNKQNGEQLSWIKSEPLSVSLKS